MPDRQAASSLSSLDRRTLLRLTAGGAGIGLAGCSGKGNTVKQTTEQTTESSGSGDETTTDSGGTPVDKAFTTKVQIVPKNIQYNPYNPSNGSGETNSVLFDPLAKYNKFNDEWIPVIFSDWTLDGDKLDIEISKDHTWHDGDPVTANDVATQWRIDLELGQPLSDYADSVTVNGEHSLTLSLTSSDLNSDILYLNIFGNRLFVKEDIFSDKLKALQEASSKEEKDKAKKDILKWAIHEPVGNGPFKFKSADSQRVLTVKHKEYPGADQINFPQYEFKYLASNQKRWQALMSGATDGEAHMGITSEVLGQMPPEVDLFRPPGKGGTSMLFQHKDTVVSDPRVRKALLYLIDGKQLSLDSTLNYQFQAKSLNTGLMPTLAENYLSDDVLSGFTDYAVDEKTAKERATALLEDAGFTKSDGKWQTPEGKPFKVPLKTIGGWWSLQAQSIIGSWKRFGIEATFQSEGVGSFFTDMGEGNYVTAINFFGGNHPYQCYQTLFQTGDQNPANVPREVEVPMPVGDPDGSTETVDVPSLIDQILHTRDKEKVKELVAKAAWVYNQTVPRAPHLIGTGMTFMTHDDWEYPSSDDPSMNVFFPNYWLLRTGELKAKTK